MSVKHAETVNDYTETVVAIRNVLDNLIEFVDSLPAPDDNDELHSLHYGHIGTIEQMQSLLSQVAELADGFNQ